MDGDSDLTENVSKIEGAVRTARVVSGRAGVVVTVSKRVAVESVAAGSLG